MTSIAGEKRHQRLMRHAKGPRGLVLVFGVIFLLAWLSWNLWYTQSVAAG